MSDRSTRACPRRPRLPRSCSVGKSMNSSAKKVATRRHLRRGPRSPPSHPSERPLRPLTLQPAFLHESEIENDHAVDADSEQHPSRPAASPETDCLGAVH